MTILITGGAGFIGSNFVHTWFEKNIEPLVNLDLLTYAGNLDNLKKFENDSRHIFKKGNIVNKSLINEILSKYNPRAIINFAAESHVDKSISSPDEFIQTNIVGTYNLLVCANKYYDRLPKELKKNFKYIQISTDEVFGSLKKNEARFSEKNLIKPNSPYSASKAASDHLVRSFNKTFNLPTIVTHCSNNYGPYQYPEKFIPLVIKNALNLNKIPIYGDGLYIRDWLHVKDHCLALIEILNKGKAGETYNIGGDNEKTNNDVVAIICATLDKMQPLRTDSNLKNYIQLVDYVKDRPGHDRRYAIDANKLKNELNWHPKIKFDLGINNTIKWYLSNQNWVNKLEKVNSL